MLQSLATSLVDTALNQWILNTYWLWPILEISHFVGLTLLFGGLLIVDLRLAGLFKDFDPRATHGLIPLVLLGFGINLITGILFFVGDPMRYTVNIGFQLKMILILIAGMNALVHYWKVHPNVHEWAEGGESPWPAKTVGLISLASWTGVLLLGRLIPYVGTG